MNRKAQLGGLTNNILALVIAIIVLVMGLVVVQEIRDTDIISQAEGASYTNESVTTVTQGGDNLNCNNNPAAQCSVSLVINATEATVVIDSTNYSVTGCSLAVNDDNSHFNNTNWNVTYSCNYGGTAYSSGNESLVGLGNFSDFVPIIVIAIAASIIIGLILLGFAFSNRRTR